MAWELGPPHAGWGNLECAALVGEDQPLCADLLELDLFELDVNDLDDSGFLGGLKWYNDQSKIISHPYPNEPSNIFEGTWTKRPPSTLRGCSLASEKCNL
ncbi:peroxisome proliferator-activated receptor gamma coactivator 1-alpha-like [Vipera latastei]